MRTITSICLGAVLSMAAIPAHAGMPVICENCATWWDDAVAYALQGKQWIEEAATNLNTLNTYKDAALNTVNLVTSVPRMVEADLRYLSNLTSRNALTGGYSGQMLGGLTGAAGNVSALANYPAMVAAQTRAVGNALKSSAEMLGLETTQLGDSGARLAALEGEGLDSQGRNAILQSSLRLNAANGEFQRTRAASDIAYQQAILTDMTARQERDSYLTTLTSAQHDAAITNACTAFANTGVNVQMPACATWAGTTNTITASR